jgi:hypothetical protein
MIIYNMMMHDDWSVQGAQEFVEKMRCLTCGKARSDVPVSAFKVRALLDSVGASIRGHEILYTEAWSIYATEVLQPPQQVQPLWRLRMFPKRLTILEVYVADLSMNIANAD